MNRKKLLGSTVKYFIFHLLFKCLCQLNSDHAVSSFKIGRYFNLQRRKVSTHQLHCEQVRSGGCRCSLKHTLQLYQLFKFPCDFYSAGIMCVT